MALTPLKNNAGRTHASRAIGHRVRGALLVGLMLATSSVAQAQTGINTPTGDKNSNNKIREWNISTAIAAKVVWVATSTIRMGLKVMQDVQRYTDDVTDLHLTLRFELGERKLLAQAPALIAEVATDADLTRTAALSRKLLEDPIDTYFREEQMVALAVADAVQESELARAEAAELGAHSRYLQAALDNGASMGDAVTAVPEVGAASGLRMAAFSNATALLPGQRYTFSAARAPDPGPAPDGGAECRNPFPAALSVAPEVQTPRITTAAIGAQAISQARQARLDQQLGNVEAMAAAREARNQDRYGILGIWRIILPAQLGF